MNTRASMREVRLDPTGLAAEWGWDNPTEEILEIAAKSLYAQTVACGEILVAWGALDAITRDRLLARKPKEIQTLQYFAEQEPMRVLQYVEQILALQKGYPFYERLSLLEVHPEMAEQVVRKRCDELDVVMMNIEGRRAVLVFSKWEALLKYSTMGSAKLSDPLYRASGNTMPLLAVGSRDDISSVLNMHHEDGSEAGGESGNKLWNATSDEMNTPEGRELARLFDHALVENATDVSLKPSGRNGAVKVMIRKWGRLVTPFRKSKAQNSSSGDADFVFSPELASKAINLLASKSGANPSGTRMRIPSDGQITYRSTTGDAFMRLNFIPLNHLGEIKDLRSVSVRLFSRNESSIALEDLRIPENVADQIRDAVRMPQGLILVAGPVNSGKSSTIAGAIGEHVNVFGDTSNRLSVEDPIERHLKGITQINVPTHIQDQAERFNVTLRAIKRHDLNLLWVGEVRDRQSAEFCVAFAGSGHLVLSTIHAKDSILAYDILSQMVDAGVRFQLAESMALSVSQRLVKTLCPHCSPAKNMQAPTEQERRLFELNLQVLGEKEELPELVNRPHPGGCDKCDDGYSGSLPICEVLPFTRAVKDSAIALLNNENMREQRQRIADARTVTLLQSGLDLVKQGKVDINSILFF
jgi:type IV pilus assembly protein PilB